MMGDTLDFRDADWVAERLNIDKNAVYRYLNEGVLPGLQLGRKWLISESSLVAHLKAEERRQTEARRQLGLNEPEFYRRFDRLTERARRVLLVAQAEAVKRNFPYVGQEHILLGIATVPGSAGLAILARLGVLAEQLRTELDAVMPDIVTGEVSGNIGLTERAKRAIELAAEEARDLKQDYVGVEHLLIGMLREGEGFGYQVLARLGVTLDEARSALQGQLDAVQASHEHRAGADPSKDEAGIN